MSRWRWVLGVFLEAAGFGFGFGFGWDSGVGCEVEVRFGRSVDGVRGRRLACFVRGASLVVGRRFAGGGGSFGSCDCDCYFVGASHSEEDRYGSCGFVASYSEVGRCGHCGSAAAAAKRDPGSCDGLGCSMVCLGAAGEGSFGSCCCVVGGDCGSNFLGCCYCGGLLDHGIRHHPIES